MAVSYILCMFLVKGQVVLTLPFGALHRCAESAAVMHHLQSGSLLSWEHSVAGYRCL